MPDLGQTRVGAKSVTYSEAMPALSCVTLEHTRVTDEGVKSLVPARPRLRLSYRRCGATAMERESLGIPATATPPATRPKRRWRTMSLRALMLLIVVLAGWLAWQTSRARAQRRAVETIESQGGIVFYDDYIDEDGRVREKRGPRSVWKRWVKIGRASCRGSVGWWGGVG